MDRRHQDILAVAQRNGHVTVEELATALSLTPQTIRRDLNLLCREGHLRRTHGGATLASTLSNVRYTERRMIARDSKIAIGRAVAERIPDRASLFINVGTTTEEVARALTGRIGLLVITNNLNVADILATSRNDVILVGGRMRASDRAMIGPYATGFIRNFKVDIAIIGASAIDRDGSLLDFDAEEVEVAQAIIGNARTTILASDSSKLSRAAPFRIAGLSQISVFVTDRIADDTFCGLCKDLGTELIQVGGTNEA